MRNPGDSPTVDYREIPSFGTSDERLTDRGWRVARIGTTHRDADALTQSNHRVLMRELAKADPGEDAHGVMHCSHWAVGWMDHIVVDPANAAVMKVIRDCAKRIDDYPVLDEFDYSDLSCELHADNRCGDDCSECESERSDHKRGDCRENCRLCADESKDDDDE